MDETIPDYMFNSKCGTRRTLISKFFVVFICKLFSYIIFALSKYIFAISHFWDNCEELQVQLQHWFVDFDCLSEKTNPVDSQCVVTRCTTRNWGINHIEECTPTPYNWLRAIKENGNRTWHVHLRHHVVLIPLAKYPCISEIICRILKG